LIINSLFFKDINSGFHSVEPKVFFEDLKNKVYNCSKSITKQVMLNVIGSKNYFYVVAKI